MNRVTNPTHAITTSAPLGTMCRTGRPICSNIMSCEKKTSNKRQCFKGNKTFDYLKMYNFCDKKYGCYLYFFCIF